VAAARETFEECGVLLAGDAAGRPAVHDDDLAAERASLLRDEIGFAEVLGRRGLRVDDSALVPYAVGYNPPIDDTPAHRDVITKGTWRPRRDVRTQTRIHRHDWDAVLVRYNVLLGSSELKNDPDDRRIQPTDQRARTQARIRRGRKRETHGLESRHKCACVTMYVL
jgi:hypothetical protein